jgi:LPS O-antigen subunit length determinant protein (WzzB/FepE family)
MQQNFGAASGGRRFKIEAKIPKDSRIIIIESKGPDTDQALHVKLHSQILDKLAQDHDPEVDFVKLTMENELNRARNQLDKLKDEAVLLQSQGKRLDEQELLLKEQLKDIEKLIDSSEANRNKAVAEVEGEAKAMTLMLIDNETKKYLDRAGEIKERLLVGLSDDRDKLKNDLAENLRNQTELQERLQELQAKIVNVRYTRPILPTIRSIEPEGIGKPVVIALAVILGLMAGLFTAFVAEFRLKVKERLNEHPSTSMGGPMLR